MRKGISRSILRLAAMGMWVSSGAAYSAPGKTTWTGYLYQGPGYRYSVTDEVPQASSIDVGRCADGWCEATVGGRVGYLRAEIVTLGSLDKPAPGILAQPAAALSPSPPKGPCFEANLTGGNGGNAMTVFCQK